MNYKRSKNVYVSEKHKGVVLLFTLVLLVVLVTLSYTLTTKVRAQRSRDQYMVDYQAARYACDSVIKYNDDTLKGLKFKLISRPNEPDFSDLFSLTDEEYQQLIDIWTIDSNYVDTSNDSNSYEDESLGFKSMASMAEFYDFNDMNDPNYPNEFSDDNAFYDSFDRYNESNEPNEPNEITIRGPYGPEWPYVAEPMEIEIGTAKVTVEIVDENSKYPIGWVLIENEAIEKEAIAGFESFCEWMDINSLEIEQLFSELDEIREVKEFPVEFKLTNIGESKDSNDPNDLKDPNDPNDPNDTGTTKSDSKQSKKVSSIRKNVKKTKESKEKEIYPSTHMADFARLFNSTIIDTSLLSRATQISDERHESALKYISLWPVGKVNINTAPRNVLEAAFVFGGDQVAIADEVIVARREKPFKDIDELKKTLFEYSNSIAKCEKFITTESDFFTVRITGVSGAAKVTSVVAVKKNGKAFEIIAVISG